MKKNQIIAGAVALVMVAAAVFLGLSGKPVDRDGSLYLTDRAGVVSPAEASAFLSAQQSASPRLSVAVVRSTGKLSMADYCVQLWENWRLGTSDLLLLLDVDRQDYYFGYSSDATFAETLDRIYPDLLERYLEPDFAAGSYGRAILAFSDGVQAALRGIGPSGYYSGETADFYVTPQPFTHGSTSLILLLVVAIVVVALISAASIGRRPRRRGFRPMAPPPPRRPARPIMPPPPIRTARPPQPPRTPRAPSRPMMPSSRPSGSMRSSRPGGFTGGGRSSGGFTGGGRSSGGMRGGGRSGGFSGGGRSGGGMRGGKR